MSRLHSPLLLDSLRAVKRRLPGTGAKRAAGAGLSVLLVSLLCLPWLEANAQARDGSVVLLYPELPGPSPLKNPYVEQVAEFCALGSWGTALAWLHQVRQYEKKAGRDSTILNWADYVEGTIYFFKYNNSKYDSQRDEDARQKSVKAFERVFRRDPSFKVNLRRRDGPPPSDPDYLQFLAHVARIRQSAPMPAPQILEATPVPGGESSIDVQLKIAGRAEFGGRLALFLEGLEVEGTRVESDGSWQIEIRLPYGRHTLTAAVADEGGRVGPASAGFEVLIERAPPPPAPAPVSPEGPPGWLRGFMVGLRAGLEAGSAEPEWVTGLSLEFFPLLPSDRTWLGFVLQGSAPVFLPALDAASPGLSLSSPLTLRAELHLYPLDAPLPGKQADLVPYLLGGGGLIVPLESGPEFSSASWRLGAGVALQFAGRLTLLGDAAVNFHPAGHQAAVSLSVSGGLGLSL